MSTQKNQPPVVWNRKLDPAETRRSPLQTAPPVTRRDLGNRFHTCALRRFHMNEEGRCDRFRQEIEEYVDKHGLGEVLWPMRDFIFATNFQEIVDYVAERGLWIFDVWNYVPEGDFDKWQKMEGEYGIRVDHRLAAVEDGPSGDAHAILLSRLGPKFLGWDNGEQDGRYMGSYAMSNCPSARSRREGWKRFARYMRRLADQEARYLNVLQGLYSAHQLAHMGCHRLLGAETGQMLPSVPPWYAFIRGAGKQYGLLWFGNASVFNRWGFKSYEKENEYAGPEKGTSFSLLKRLWHAEFAYGSCMMSFENAHVQDGELTPVGQLQKQCYDWCRRHEDLGPQHTPVAFLLDFHSGWQPPRTAYGLSWPYRVWGEMDYSVGDHQVDQVFRTVWPGYEDASYYKDERGFLTSTPAGDVFDVLTANAGEETLNRYQCLMVLGDLAVEGRVWRKSRNYAAVGGEVVVAVNQLGMDAIEGLELDVMDEKGDSVSIRPDGTRFEEAAFSYRRVAAKNGEVALSASNGDPLILRIPVGEGFVTVITVPFGLAKPNPDFSLDFDPSLPVRHSESYHGPTWGEDQPLPSPHSLLMGVRTHLLDLFSNLNLVKIESDAPIQHIVNVGAAADRLTLTLINNSKETWTGSVALAHGKLVELEDLLSETPFDAEAVLTLPAGEVGVYQLKAKKPFMTFAQPERAAPNPVRLATWSRIDPERTIEENIDLLRRTDVRGVELWAPQILDLPEEEARLLMEQIVAAELEVVAINAVPCQTPAIGAPFGYNIPLWRRRAAELTDKLVRAAEIFQAKRIVVTGDGCKSGDKNFQRLAMDVADLARRVRTTGIDVIVEMAPGCHAERFSPWAPPPAIDTLANLIDAIDQTNVLAGLNLGHVRCLGQDPVEVAKALGKRLDYVQLNAFGHSLGGARLDAHRPHDEDSEAADALLGHLGESGFSGVVALDGSPEGDHLAETRRLLAETRKQAFLDDWKA